MRSGCLSGTHFSYPETKIRGVVPVSGPVSGPASGPASGPVSGLYPALHSYLSPCLPLRFCPPNRPCLRPLRSGLLFYLTARRTRCSAFRPWNSQGPQPAERTKKRRKRIAGRRRVAAAREAPEAPPYAPPRLPPPNRKTERTPIAAPDPQPPASAADSEQNLPLPRTAKTHPSGPYRKKPGRVVNNSHRIIRFSAQRAPLRGRKLSTITVTFHCTEQCRRPQLLKTNK